MAKPGKRADKSTIQKRIEMVVALILKGERDSRIREGIADRWNISPRQAGNYLKKAREQIQQDFAVDRETLILEHRAKILDLYKEARAQGKLAVCAALLRDQSNLLGLNQSVGDSIDIVVNAGYTVIEE